MSVLYEIVNKSLSLKCLSKTTKYEDVLGNVCPSAHYLAHAEFLPFYICVLLFINTDPNS
jgi:hypothetical protein